MNILTKSIAVLSAVFLLSACETPTGSSSETDGSGMTGGGAGMYGDGSSEIAPGVKDRVFFDLDSSQLDSEAQGTLERQAQWMSQNPNVNVTMEGHCDERGTREYNLALGERRAAAAKKYLVGLGVAPSRISTISYGKERPAVIGSDESAWGHNRRAVTVIVN
ncbi:MAG: peptidoglycan-associated lipoprotein Pal [Alphaproteobacteria bacterium]